MSYRNLLQAYDSNGMQYKIEKQSRKEKRKEEKKVVVAKKPLPPLNHYGMCPKLPYPGRARLP